MNKKKGFIVGLFAIGVIILIYPNAAQFINNQNPTIICRRFSCWKRKPPQQRQNRKKIEDARECNTAIFRNDEGLSDPFTEGYNPHENPDCSQVLKEGSLTADSQGNTTNIDTFATLEIPKLGLHIPILLDASDYTLSQGIGQVEGSSLPVGGLNSHTVLGGPPRNGHERNVSKLRRTSTRGCLLYSYIGRTARLSS